ncbi:serine protein kinase RIO [Candidatus Woesearchaeota archaeon]|nr:serine protein kinase RIO [Candidatus Woesearchaeota archaeon]
MPRQKEEFKTYKDVFDQSTIKTLFKLISEGRFEGLQSPIFMGKEANVFTALTKNKKTIIVKIYRIQSCDFKKMYNYICTDPRFKGIQHNRMKIVYTWTQREYRNLLKARSAGVKVPTPIAFMKNIIVMESIGNENPAPKIKDKPAKNMKKFFEAVVLNMKKLYQKAGLIHADLSSFNILNHKDKPVFIDFSQATTTKDPNYEEYLDRDIRNTCNFFKKYTRVDKIETKKQILGQKL